MSALVGFLLGVYGTGAVVTAVHPHSVPVVGSSTRSTSSAPVNGHTGLSGKWWCPLVAE